MTILDSSKLKDFADNNVKFDENGSKLSKQGKNTVGKREIAHKDQFLIFPVFSKDLQCRHVKPGIVWEKFKRKKKKESSNTQNQCFSSVPCNFLQILKYSILLF